MVFDAVHEIKIWFFIKLIVSSLLYTMKLLKPETGGWLKGWPFLNWRALHLW